MISDPVRVDREGPRRVVSADSPATGKPPFAPAVRGGSRTYEMPAAEIAMKRHFPLSRR